ncbi:hypothetical protein NDU88_006230 [Pleurodeles waltl]|uniref:Uncharacterized protein n=1 Tax=Pleurodeles waltl TaxID=8319 RepID=A0AAV7SP27_PLEWA|nr:hypothetical protein NDU88_006230 [Pleurodeles waltl]
MCEVMPKKRGVACPVAKELHRGPSRVPTRFLRGCRGIHGLFKRDDQLKGKKKATSLPGVCWPSREACMRHTSLGNLRVYILDSAELMRLALGRLPNL